MWQFLADVFAPILCDSKCLPFDEWLLNDFRYWLEFTISKCLPFDEWLLNDFRYWLEE